MLTSFVDLGFQIKTLETELSEVTKNRESLDARLADLQETLGQVTSAKSILDEKLVAAKKLSEVGYQSLVASQNEKAAVEKELRALEKTVKELQSATVAVDEEKARLSEALDQVSIYLILSFSLR